MLFKTEAEELKKAHWPKCDALADSLASKGTSAADALEFAAKSRIHHVRSACLAALNKIAPDRAKRLSSEMMSDKAYEVRETAAQILGVPVKEKL